MDTTKQSRQSRARATQSARERQRAAEFDTLPDSAPINTSTLCALLGVTPEAIYQRVAAGTWPKPHKPGSRYFWSAGEVRRALRGEVSQ